MIRVFILSRDIAGMETFQFSGCMCTIFSYCTLGFLRGLFKSSISTPTTIFSTSTVCLAMRSFFTITCWCIITVNSHLIHVYRTDILFFNAAWEVHLWFFFSMQLERYIQGFFPEEIKQSCRVELHIEMMLRPSSFRTNSKWASHRLASRNPVIA